VRVSGLLVTRSARGQARRQQGFSFVELLAAVIILLIVAAGAVSTWSLSSRAPVNKRLTDMASMVAVREIERVKSKKYLNILNGTTTTYYTKAGAVSGATADNFYLATTVLSTIVDRDGISNTEDVVQVQVTVQNAAGSKTYEVQRTLMAFGGF
jgi:prepilin-type N-terminal cleavage/methylation domain-containing protein